MSVEPEKLIFVLKKCPKVMAGGRVINVWWEEGTYSTGERNLYIEPVGVHTLETQKPRLDVFAEKPIFVCLFMQSILSAV